MKAYITYGTPSVDHVHVMAPLWVLIFMRVSVKILGCGYLGCDTV
jgi:hypothetical protein